MIKIKSQQKIIRNKKTIFREVEGVVYILDPANGTIHTLNLTASFIWLQLKSYKMFAELIEIVFKEFSVNKSILRQDLEKFINHYVKEGFILIN